MNTENRSQQHNALFWLIVIGLVVVISGYWIVTITPPRLQYTPEPFTSLYFSDHIHLPKSITAGEQVHFSFIIENHESSDFVYQYRVTLQNSQGTVELNSASASVAEGKQITITQYFKIPLQNETSVIAVHLLNQDQSIHFSVET